jgi:hypothetical protein
VSRLTSKGETTCRTTVSCTNVHCWPRVRDKQLRLQQHQLVRPALHAMELNVTQCKEKILDTYVHLMFDLGSDGLQAVRDEYFNACASQQKIKIEKWWPRV